MWWLCTSIHPGQPLHLAATIVASITKRMFGELSYMESKGQLCNCFSTQWYRVRITVLLRTGKSKAVVIHSLLASKPQTVEPASIWRCPSLLKIWHYSLLQFNCKESTESGDQSQHRQVAWQLPHSGFVKRVRKLETFDIWLYSGIVETIAERSRN